MQWYKAIDRAAVSKGMDPFADAKKVLTALNKYGNEEWLIVDKVAQLKHESSEETRNKVKEVYESRYK